MALRQRRQLELGLFEGAAACGSLRSLMLIELCSVIPWSHFTAVQVQPHHGSSWAFPSLCLQIQLFGEAGIDLPKAKLSPQPPPAQEGILD